MRHRELKCKKAKMEEMTVSSVGELVGHVELSYIAPGCIK